MVKTYKTQGVCAKEIKFNIENDKITEVSFVGGCNGNLSGISSLCKGLNTKEVIEKLEGINCGSRGTSCPDQFAKALKEVD